MFRKLTLAAVLAVSASGPAVAESEVHIEDFDFSFEGPFRVLRSKPAAARPANLHRDLLCMSRYGTGRFPHICMTKAGQACQRIRCAHTQLDLRSLTRALMMAQATTARRHLRTSFQGRHCPSAPDLSLMAKSRAGFHGPYGTGLNQLFKGMGGAEYIASLMTGYEEAPECAPEDFEGSYNSAFAAGGFPESCIDDHGHHMVPGSWIAMGQPLYGEDLDFDDGHSNSLHHEAQDVAAFLMWAAEPKMMARKQAGLTGVIFLALLSVLLYLTNKRLWAPHKHKDD